eukprot:scaffold149995_cov19-Prasinocladus_malaysianus.AAC.2
MTKRDTRMLGHHLVRDICAILLVGSIKNCNKVVRDQSAHCQWYKTSHPITLASRRRQLDFKHKS